MSALAKSTSSAAIARQIVLPWGKSMDMAFASLRLRFFRSLVTALSLVLAIAFLSYILTNTAIARELYRLHGEKAAEMLLQAGYQLGSNGELATGPREIWLMILSLLVCTVGIVNAQLMSVTERFREIGIMKCLGALDRIILRLFLIEALILGTAGSAVGGVLGGLAACAGSAIQYSGLSMLHMHLAPLFAEVGKALIGGIFLSILGVLYPAILAAKLRPVLVMKEEQ